MSPTMITTDQLQDGFPRVSGDEPAEDGNRLLEVTFSPRERG